MTRLTDISGYRRFWAASAVSIFGAHVTTLALQAFTMETLGATAFEFGLLNAARWLPYLLFGLVVGVIVDRYRRKPILVATDLGRAALLCAIPALYLLDRLSMPVLTAFVAMFGLLSLVFDAANQSLLPRLVPRELLTPANARLEQADSVAQTAGPLLAGVLIKTVGAPLAMLVDAASYLVSGLLLATIKVEERARPVEGRNLLAELRQGLAWVYRHRTLASMALTGHAWFLFNSLLSTVFAAYAIDRHGLALGAFLLGVAYACGGVGAVLGGALAGWAGRRFDVGPTMVTCRMLMPLAWVLVPLTAPGPAAIVPVAAAQFLFWLVMGIEGPNEMGYRQSVTPDDLQGRMNTTIRSLNRAAIVAGAPLGGWLAVSMGYRPALWAGIAGFALVAVALALSPFRRASYSDALENA